MLKLKSIPTNYVVGVNEKIGKEAINNLGWNLKSSSSKRLIKGGYYLYDTSWFSENVSEFGKIYVFLEDNAVHIASIPNFNKIHDRSGRSNVFRITSLEKLKEFNNQFIKLSKVYDKLYFIDENFSIDVNKSIDDFKGREISIGAKFSPYQIKGVIQAQYFELDEGLKLIVMLDRKIAGRTLGDFAYKNVSQVMITVYPKLIDYFRLKEFTSSRISYFKQDLSTRYNDKLYLNSKGELRVDEIVICMDAKIQLV